MIKYQSITESLISDSNTVRIIDLGFHGFADSFFPEDKLVEAKATAPLICRLDKISGLVQVENLTHADNRYNLVDYSYTSSNSKLSRNHWLDFIKSVHSRKKMTDGKILEIGSNDGYLLQLASAYSKNILGVDASEFMTQFSNNLGIRTINGLFGESNEIIEKIQSVNKKFSFIFANNVLNHSNNPINFILEVSELLAEDGIFVFEVPYWLETVRSLKFDQIYHEHITYFSIESVEYLLNKCGMFINDIQITDYHGGSLRIYAGLNDLESSSKDDLLKYEKTFDLKVESTYIRYMEQINRTKCIFLDRLNRIQHNPIFGVGAAAKANTFLTFYELNYSKIDFILDSSPFKQGKFTPVSLIPIVDDEFVKTFSGGTGIVLAWNLGMSLKNRLLSINSNLNFINSLGTLI